MNPESHLIIDLIRARTRQMRLLAADMAESRKALVQLDLDAIYQHTSQQQTLCQEIQRLDAQVMRYATAAASIPGSRTLSLGGAVTGWDEETLERLRSLLQEHEAARNEVQEISRVQTELLRRSRRYLRILSNLVSNSMGFYEAPGFQSALPEAAGGI